MKKLLGWLFGTVTARVTGAQPEDFLNLCARENLILWRMLQREPFVLEVQVTARQYPRLLALAQGAQCEAAVEKRQGLPFFLLRFRRRYAMMAGLVLCLAVFAVGSRTVLTFDVTGNEGVTEEEILSQLRLCGVSVGTYGPNIPVREVENRVMLAMNELSYFSLNLHGTRAEVIVRERSPVPEVLPEEVPSDVVSVADGIVTHIEPWMGDAQFQEGDQVKAGDVLISGLMFLDPPPNRDGDLGTLLVHGDGKVLARTWRTLQASLPLNTPVKAYTGEETTRYSLSILGKRVNFYKNSGISYPNYDTITRFKSWTPWKGKTLPVVWEKEVFREYTLAQAPLDQAAAEAMLKQRLMASLTGQMDQGKVLTADYEVSRQGEVLTVKLLAQCTEQIGKVVARPEEIRAPYHDRPESMGPERIPEDSYAKVPYPETPENKE